MKVNQRQRTAALLIFLAGCVFIWIGLYWQVADTTSDQQPAVQSECDECEIS